MRSPIDYTNTSPEILAFEKKARNAGVIYIQQANYTFYDKADSEYYLVRI